MARSNPGSDFRVFTTLRYVSTAPFHVPTPPSHSPSTSVSGSTFHSLSTHIARLQTSASAASWVFPDTTFWGSHTPTSLHTHLSTAIPDKIAEADPQAPPDQPWRIRLDLTSPAAGGNLIITVGKTGILPAFRGFDPFLPARLPSPEEVTAAAIDAGGYENTSGCKDMYIPSTWKLFLNPAPTPRDFHTRYKTSERAVYDDARKGHGLDTEIVLQVEGDGMGSEGNEVMDGTISSLYFWRDSRWVTPRAEAGGLRSVSREWALQSGLAAEERIVIDDLKLGEVVWCSNGLRGFGWGSLEDYGGRMERTEG